MSHCVAVDLEEGRKGVILSVECEYDEEGAPTDQLSQHSRHWFSSAQWPVTSVSEVIRDLKTEDGGIRHCIQAGIDRANQGTFL